MQNLRNLTDSDLFSKTQSLAQEERKLILAVLHHIKEVGRRRLHAQRGFNTLFDYLVRGLHYSEGAAARRLGAMKLLKDILAESVIHDIKFS